MSENTMSDLTREQKLKLREEMEKKYVGILADINHPLYDETRWVILAPECDLASINWHPDYFCEDPAPTLVELLAQSGTFFVNGACSICGETSKSCECHQW